MFCGIDGAAASLVNCGPAIPQNIRDIISQSNRNRKKNKQKKKVCIESSKKGEGYAPEEGKERSGVDQIARLWQALDEPKTQKVDFKDKHYRTKSFN